MMSKEADDRAGAPGRSNMAQDAGDGADAQRLRLLLSNIRDLEALHAGLNGEEPQRSSQPRPSSHNGENILDLEALIAACDAEIRYHASDLYRVVVDDISLNSSALPSENSQAAGTPFGALPSADTATEEENEISFAQRPKEHRLRHVDSAPQTRGDLSIDHRVRLRHVASTPPIRGQSLDVGVAPVVSDPSVTQIQIQGAEIKAAADEHGDAEGGSLKDLHNLSTIGGHGGAAVMVETVKKVILRVGSTAGQAVKMLEPRQKELASNQRISHNRRTGEPFVVTLACTQELGANTIPTAATSHEVVSPTSITFINSFQPSQVQNQQEQKRPSFFCSRKVLTSVYGEAVGQYAAFQLYLLCVNVVLVLIALVAFVPHAVDTGPKLRKSGQAGPSVDTIDQLLDVFFLSSFQPSHDGYWTAMMSLSYAVAFASGPLYFVLCRYKLIDVPTEQMVKLNADDDVMLTPEEYKKCCCGHLPKLVLQTLSYFLFLLCMGVPIAVMWVLLYGLIAALAELNYHTWSEGDAQLSQALLAIAAASSVTVANSVFFLVVGLLTGMEMHGRYSQFRRHRLFKLCLYRFVNTSALFVWSYYSELPWNICVTKRIAMQHLLFVFADLFVNNIVAFIMPFLYRAVCPFCCPCCYGEELPPGTDCCACPARPPTADPLWPEFELSDEYLKTLFRQFLLISSMSVFPLVSLVALIANVIEWPLTKYRLIHLSRKPHGTLGGYPTLSLLLIIIAVGALFLFPTGWFFFAKGPWLCWPCPQFSQVQGINGDVCSAEFDLVTCPLHDGSSTSVQRIRDVLDQLKGEDEAGRQEAKAWLHHNDHLFWSRRCACSPCVQALDCACSKPLLNEECESLTPFSCHATAPNPGSECGGVAEAAEECGGAPCQRSRSWAVNQCGLHRAAYSKPAADEWAAGHVATCRAIDANPLDAASQRGEEDKCARHAECGDKEMCDTYCPLHEHGRWVGRACWLCEAVHKGGLVNPRQAKASWQGLKSICQRCLRSNCVCEQSCKIV